jgi:membrane protein CcdC involved in cytochrome C biogenesis
MAWGLAAIPLFEIVMKQSKALIAPVIGLLLVRAMLKPVTEFYSFVLPQHRELFYGVSNILFFK